MGEKDFVHFIAPCLPVHVVYMSASGEGEDALSEILGQPVPITLHEKIFDVPQSMVRFFESTSVSQEGPSFHTVPGVDIVTQDECVFV